jgi:hypothetical protein
VPRRGRVAAAAAGHGARIVINVVMVTLLRAWDEYV